MTLNLNPARFLSAHLMKNLRLGLTALMAVMAATPPVSAAPLPARPNIIVILVDDMGFSDIGCYGSEIPTPNLDALAKNGLRFTQFYNTARCCPTRASLLTGLYPHQAGVGHMTQDKGVPGYSGRLNDRCVTFAEVLRPAGYFTAMSGKWHVGQNLGIVPWERGFERSLNAAAGGFYFPDSPRTELFLNGVNVGRRGSGVPEDWYSTDLWTDFGIKFIDEALAAKKPFFLYLAHNAPHFPLQAPPADIAKFRGQYKVGWDKLREARHRRQIEMGIVDKAWPLSPRPDEVSAWEKLTPQQQDHFDHIMAIYAAVVNHMDASIGRLVAALKQRGVLDNTLILFMSDNGGNAESGPEGRLKGEPPGAAQSDVFCGQSWATLENTPFRRYKHYNHEGGIATPLIAHWPAGIKARGELRHQPGHLVDIMTTCANVAGAKYPTEFNGKPIQPMEGRSLVPAFGNQSIQREALYWEHEGNAAIRVGDWKLVRLGRAGPWELYDLKADRTEQHNVAAEKPELVKQLAAKWDTWATRAQVKPYPRDAAKSAGKRKAGKKSAAKSSTVAAAGRWPEAKANAWLDKHGWLAGCNFMPSSAINQLEMWQADTFDLATIDRELGWAASLGFNSVRVFLHDLLWKQDAPGFLDRMDKFLAVADKHRIGVMFVLFDSCWDPFPKLGRQRAPKPGLHNSGWVQSPGAEVLKDPAKHDALRAYVTGVVGRFRDDRRVQVWDVWNEPNNTNDNSYGRDEPKDKAGLVRPLLAKAFAWAREARPTQPLTSGVWQGNWADADKLRPMEVIQIENSDVISFHNYAKLDELKQCVENLRRYHRPILCTEYMARPAGSTFDPHLGWMKAQRVAAYNWGFVDGKTQTIYPWDSWKKSYASEPPVWFHDIFRRDGTPYVAQEVEYIRSVTGKAKR